MVYKIRNTSFFWTRSGVKNNWFPQHMNMPKPITSDITFAIKTRYDHHSFLRGNSSHTELLKLNFHSQPALQKHEQTLQAVLLRRQSP